MLTADELAILRNPKMQEYIREKMGPWESGDVFFEPSNEELGLYHSDLTKYLVEVTEIWRIPDCISRDSKRPERGLVGMLDDSWEIIKPCLSDKWMVRCLDEQMGQGPDALSYVQNISFSGAPRLALLKALEWQIRRKG